jgi:hypothetical protein
MCLEKNEHFFQVAGFRQSFAEYRAVFAGFRQIFAEY